MYIHVPVYNCVPAAFAVVNKRRKERGGFGGDRVPKTGTCLVLATSQQLARVEAEMRW